VISKKGTSESFVVRPSPVVVVVEDKDDADDEEAEDADEEEAEDTSEALWP